MKYYRYQLTYPIEGSKIYKSRQLKNVVKKCYKEYKKINDIHDGLFCITNIDTNVEHQFGIKNNKIKKQTGGSQDDIKNDLKSIENSIPSKNDNMNILISGINNIKNDVDDIKRKLNENIPKEPVPPEPKEPKTKEPEESKPKEPEESTKTITINTDDNTESDDTKISKLESKLNNDDKQAIKNKYIKMLEDKESPKSTKSKPPLPQMEQPPEKQLPREANLIKSSQISSNAKDDYKTLYWENQNASNNDDVCTIM